MEITTELLYGSEKVVDRLVRLMGNAQLTIDVCVDHKMPSLAIGTSRLKDALIDARRRHVRIRYITEITKDNLDYCKELLLEVDELRHLDGIKGNLYVSEQEYSAPYTLHEVEESSDMMIYSNVKEIREHQQCIFGGFWKTSSTAERKITEIQSDISLGISEIIDRPSRTKELFINSIKCAKSEVLLMLPTVNSFMREYRIGVIQLIKELSTMPEERAIDIRILTPVNNAIEKILEEMKTKKGLHEEESTFSSEHYYNSHLQIRHLESQSDFKVTMVTILVVDRKTSIVIEKIDDSKEDFIEAVLLSTHSTSKPTVVSYVSIFENFWNQVELYQKLNQHDRMQNEFINIAAHELRTPAQSILGYAELAKSDTQHTEKQIQSFIEVIYRNAFRIQKLTKDILDVARIESHTLRLDKIIFNLEEVIQNAIEDTKLKPVADGHNVKLEFKRGRSSKGILVVADRDRITQVISNLLDNALKFTSEGVVSVDASIEKEYKERKEEEEMAVVSIQDTGSGIDPEIFPGLFTKFSSKSFSGTGLGLYISKSIIEAHDGKIWAQNNNGHGKSGATFSFSLPLALRARSS